LSFPDSWSSSSSRAEKEASSSAFSDESELAFVFWLNWDRMA
jgi:hypothetical protein